MGEYELYTRILSSGIKHKDQKILTEGKAKHRAKICDKNCDSYIVYRYDQEEMDELFFPFFNKSHNDGDTIVDNPVPTDLLRFCDYIIIAERNNRLYVILIEMKSGRNAEARKQIDASNAFMQYIKESAKRIAKSNAYYDFDANNIVERSIILKPEKVIRPLTSIGKSKNYNQYPDFKQPYATLYSNDIPLKEICN